MITETGITSIQRILTSTSGVGDVINNIEVSLSSIKLRITGNLESDTFGTYHLGY